MKVSHILTSLLLSLLPALACAAGNDWMGSRPGNVLISQLFIPGTHDSGALYEPVPGTSKCQNLSIAEQLNAGVRFLDIRCRHLDNAFTIHHGIVFQNQKFDDVLGAVIGFLKAHPTETVIMSVKEEYHPSGNTRTFEQTFDSYIAANPDRWLLGPGIPKLDETRGKIVLLRRFSAKKLPKGIDASNWPNSTTFTNGNLRVQDAYQVSSNDTKWRAITNLFSDAKSLPSGMLLLNYTSGTTTFLGLPSILSVSDDINLRLTGYLAGKPASRRGIVIMDFADPAKCNLIIGDGKPSPTP